MVPEHFYAAPPNYNALEGTEISIDKMENLQFVLLEAQAERIKIFMQNKNINTEEMSR